ncbi:MAG: AsmA-like C-terminal region-containing protein [Beijerinckiaceae bacterium]|nr:AsmA-like C-terminal region-containing protein [Beijerinckiaceae bacterium]
MEQEAAIRKLMHARPFGWRRGLRFCLLTFATLSVLMAAALGFAYLHFRNNENSDFLRERVLAAITDIAGRDATIVLDRAGMAFTGVEPVFSLAGLKVESQQAGYSVAIGQLDLGLSSGSMFRLSLDPTRLSVSEVDLVLPPPGPEQDAVERVSAALASIAGLADLVASVPNLLAVDVPRVSVSRRGEGGVAVPFGVPFSLDIRREAGEIRLQIARARAGAPLTQAKALQLSLVKEPAVDGQKTLKLRSEVGALGALADLLDWPMAIVDPAIRLEAELDAGVGQGETRGPVRARLFVGGGVLDFTPYGVPALQLDELSIDLLGQTGSKQVEIPSFRFRSRETDIRASGTLDIEGDYKRIRLVAPKVVAKPNRDGGAPIAIEEVAMEGRIARDLSAFLVDRIAARDSGGEVQAAAQFSLAGGGLIDASVSVRGFPADKAMRLWPVFVSPVVREWIVDRMDAGHLASLTLRTRLADQVLRDAWNQKPIPDDAVAAEWRLEGVTLRAVPDAPPVRDAIVSGRVSARKAQVKAERGIIEAMANAPVSIAGSDFAIADFTRDVPVLDMRMPISGSLAGVAQLLASPGLAIGAPIPSNIASGDGQVEGLVQAQLALKAKGPRDLRIEARADLKQVAINNIAPGEKLEAGQFQLQWRGPVLSLKGDARLNGLPAQIEWRSEGEKPAVATIRATLDDAQRQRRGIDLRSVLTGPVTALATLTFEKNEPVDVDVALDLAQSRIEGIIPGYSKRAGQPAKVSFDYEAKGDRITLDDLIVDLPGVNLKGWVELQKDGTVMKAEFDEFRLSPGDNAKATIERQRNVTRIGVKGNSFDARPFLRGIQSGKVDDSKAPDFDLDLQTTVLVGFGGELLANADLQVQRRAGVLARLQAKGRFGGDALLVETAEGTSRDGSLLRIASADGGALLRFLDIYSKARGGRLAADIRVGREGQSGVVQMRDFVVRGEPLLARYTADPNFQRTPSQGQLPAGARDSVAFTKMRADFDRRPGRIELREAVMWGQQVGGTLEGVLDYSADRVDLKGALVPAYALNNLFAQVPILGPIFGGTQYEGLFALPFVIQGRASAPQLRTNAISAIAPGFLRKLFEVQREGSAGR